MTRRPVSGAATGVSATASLRLLQPQRRWMPVLVAGTAALIVATIGGLLTDIGPWYQQLKQPPWKPPDWAFGPIWTTIFALAATSGVIGWRRAPGAAVRRRLLATFAANGCLNVFWSLLFFRLQRPDWALLEVPLLWLSVLALILILWRFARLGAVLLLPYLAWVGIASVINWDTLRLNGPFGTP